MAIVHLGTYQVVPVQGLQLYCSCASAPNRKTLVTIDSMGRNSASPSATVCVMAHCHDNEIWKNCKGPGDLMFLMEDFLEGSGYTWLDLGTPRTASVSASAAGCICTKCNAKNEFAVPNQRNGTYVCFECR